MNNVELGKLGEDRAAAHLETGGYIILDRNYRFLKAEVDIVAATDREIVFVEVKPGDPGPSANPKTVLMMPKKSSFSRLLKRGCMNAAWKDHPFVSMSYP